MIIDVLPRPTASRVWVWDGINTPAIRDHLVQLGRNTGNVVDFVDNGDGTATVRSATQMYGTYEFPVTQGYWYSTSITYMGVVPELRGVEQINEMYVAYPAYGPAIPPEVADAVPAPDAATDIGTITP